MQLRQEHQLGTDEARRRVDRVAGHLSRKYGLSTLWHGDSLEITGSGVNGAINVSESDVRVEVRLGLSLMMFEGTIRSEIRSALGEHFA